MMLGITWLVDEDNLSFKMKLKLSSSFGLYFIFFSNRIPSIFRTEFKIKKNFFFFNFKIDFNYFSKIIFIFCNLRIFLQLNIFQYLSKLKFLIKF